MRRLQETLTEVSDRRNGLVTALRWRESTEKILRPRSKCKICFVWEYKDKSLSADLNVEIQHPCHSMVPAVM